MDRIGGVLIFGDSIPPLMLLKKRVASKNYKATCLDDAQFIISALRVFILTQILGRAKMRV